MDLQVLSTRQTKVMHDAKALLDLVEREGRALTPEEEKSHEGYIKSLEDIGKQIAQHKSDADMTDAINEITGANGGGDHRGLVITRMGGNKSLGQMFIESKAFTDGVELAKRRREFASDVIELKAAPIFAGGVAPAESLGQIAPGPTRRLPVQALFAQGATGANSVTYIHEASFTNAAAAVPEGGAKPESEIVLGPITEPTRKYAHTLCVSKEALDDILGIKSFIDNRMKYGLSFEIDKALLNGAAAPEVIGMLHRAGLSATVVQAAGESAADAILRQAAAVEIATGLPADGVVLNPSDWTAIVGNKDDSGAYYGSGPFAAPGTPTLWGLTVAVTPSIAPQTCLVGSFKNGASLLWRETATLSFTTSHLDHFVKNLIDFIMEARLALVVSMPASFGIVTLLAPTPPAARRAVN